MTMTRRLRRFVLTMHVTFSVGWLGAVAGFLVLSITGLTSQDTLVVRGSYLSMKSITWFIILPLSFASPLTGLILALGTRWGLFRHYWVLIKFLLTVFSTFVLLIHIQPISFMASQAAASIIAGPQLRGGQIQLVVAPSAAILVFLTAVTLAVYKPKAMTQHGQRKKIGGYIE